MRLIGPPSTVPLDGLGIDFAKRIATMVSAKINRRSLVQGAAAGAATAAVAGKVATPRRAAAADVVEARMGIFSRELPLDLGHLANCLVVRHAATHEGRDAELVVLVIGGALGRND